jgi:hypothetical protein
LPSGLHTKTLRPPQTPFAFLFSENSSFFYAYYIIFYLKVIHSRCVIS